jgi:hypothetical protein
MERIGCTTSFGLEMDNICTEKNKSLEAALLFDEIMSNVNEVEECPYPCHFLITRMTTIEYKDKKSNDTSIWLKFDKYIKVISSNYSYTGLELLAELGGYVGLLLGLSVFDLRLVFNKIFNTLMPNKPSIVATDPNGSADSIEA